MIWLAEVYSLVQKQMPDEAIDILFLHIDSLLSAGDFEGCDSVLQLVDVTQLDVNLNVALLSVTKRAAPLLKERANLVRKVKAHLMKQDAERSKRLLDGLEDNV